MRIRWLLAVAVASTAPSLGAQAPATTVALLDSLRPVIERSLAAADWTTLEQATTRLRAASGSATGRNDAWIQYDLAYALHRRASAMLVEGRTKAARPLLEEAIEAAQRAGSLGAGMQAKALEGAVTGQLAGAAGGLGAMRYGPRSFRLLDEAVENATNDPRVALLNGISRLNAPKMFGGGVEKGEPELRRAIRLFASDRNASPQPVWGLVDAHIWLAIALEKQEKYTEARVELQRALTLAPGHRWITDQLLPALNKR